MKFNKEVLWNIIVDVLQFKFSKDERLNQKIAQLLIPVRPAEEVDPIEVFAFRSEDTLFLIKRNDANKIRHLIFLDSHNQEPFHIKNIKNFKVE